MYYRANISALLMPHLEAWGQCKNGGCLRVRTLLGDAGEAVVQLEKLQDAFAAVRRIVVRVPVSGTHYVAAVFSKGVWVHAVRAVKPAPKLFTPIERVRGCMLPMTVSPSVAALRREVVTAYRSEGVFLDWLAYGSSHGWVVDTLHDLTEDQAKTILAGFMVGRDE